MSFWPTTSATFNKIAAIWLPLLASCASNAPLQQCSWLQSIKDEEGVAVWVVQVDGKSILPSSSVPLHQEQGQAEHKITVYPRANNASAKPAFLGLPVKTVSLTNQIGVDYQLQGELRGSDWRVIIKPIPSLNKPCPQHSKPAG